MQTKYILTLTALFASVPTAFAQLTIPSDGSDGAFNPTANIEIDLSQAVAGTWNTNNATNAGLGIYDRDKWSVVFKYSSVNIPSGVTVSFKNHPSHAPVVWLVSGNVTIAGTVSVNGGDTIGYTDSLLAEPGPGGFRGGTSGPSSSGAGLGIGGGLNNGSNGSYAAVYGNPSIIPLIGGSGACGSSGAYEGGGGGGAILIAAPNSINLSLGEITACGGTGTPNRYPQGSGGAIRLIANSIGGSGNLRASAYHDGRPYPPGDGRIRIETNSFSSNVIPLPQTQVVPPPPAPVIWPASNAPTVSIASVAAVAAPAYPIASLDAGADVSISVNAATQVILQTLNFPINGTVQVRSAGKFTDATWTTATFTSGDAAQATWTANVNFPIGFTTLQARATIP